MSNCVDELLRAATRDQLADCVRLLAVSLMHHRVKFGLIPLEYSMSQLHMPSEESGAMGLLIEERQVLEEAFELVRSTSLKPLAEPKKETPSRSHFSERRKQLRINVLTPIKVLWPDESIPIEVKLDNISWAGAAFHVAHSKGNVGENIKIILPSAQRGSITVKSQIIRTWDRPEGQGVAIRFSSLSTRDEVDLENLLEALAWSEDTEGQRKHARFTHRFDIQFGDSAELQAALEDISAGGLGITVPEPLELNQSFPVIISTLDDRLSFKLRAHAVRQKLTTVGGRELYHVGLEFEHPTEELRDRTTELIREIASMAPVMITNENEC
jgi:c-di-GMP-binding flagellar brake protein YcgR